MEMSSSDDEDGQITKNDEEDERYRKLYGDFGSKRKKDDDEDDQITIDDLMTCWVTRDMISKHCMAPWFEDYVTGKLIRALRPHATMR